MKNTCVEEAIKPPYEPALESFPIPVYGSKAT